MSLLEVFWYINQKSFIFILSFLLYLTKCQHIFVWEKWWRNITNKYINVFLPEKKYIFIFLFQSSEYQPKDFVFLCFYFLLNVSTFSFSRNIMEQFQLYFSFFFQKEKIHILFLFHWMSTKIFFLLCFCFLLNVSKKNHLSYMLRRNSFLFVQYYVQYLKYKLFLYCYGNGLLYIFRVQVSWEWLLERFGTVLLPPHLLPWVDWALHFLARSTRGWCLDSIYLATYH
jgi:hypothetical protein